MTRREYIAKIRELSDETEKLLNKLNEFLKPLENINANLWTEEQLDSFDCLNDAYMASIHRHIVFCTENSEKARCYN